MKDEKEKTPVSASTFILPPSSFREEGLLDARVLLAACGGDALILDKICQVFRARLPDQLAAVQDALRERDAAVLAAQMAERWYLRYSMLLVAPALAALVAR